MKNQISALKSGDKVIILAPAKSIDEENVLYAKEFLSKAGYEVVVSKNCLGQHHYYSGTELERLTDFQNALDDPGVKAIICARGGYGSVQIVDKIQWASFLRKPKWIAGFSDVTVFHQRIQKLGHQSIHGTMPLNFKTNSKEAFASLLSALKKEPYEIHAPFNEYNKFGSSNGMLVGGNLSILYSLIGTNDQIDYTDKILFIEDLAEQIYAIDRMFYALSKAGILDKIKGLIVGGMTNLSDTATPIGSNYQEIILSHFQYKSIPICFDFPAGHIDDNQALVLGSHVSLNIGKNGTILNHSKHDEIILK